MSGMLTLDQWKEIRRVDHLDLGLTSPRVRAQPANVPPLNGFDADVTAAGAATTDYERVTALSSIVVRARISYLDAAANAIPDRYTTAVSSLYYAALTDLNAIVRGVQGVRTAELVALANNAAITPKTVTLNVYTLAPVGANPNVGPIDATINAHILAANTLPGYQRAGITFQRSNAGAVPLTQVAANEPFLFQAVGNVPANVVGTFGDDKQGGVRLIRYCNASNAAAGSIDVVYVPDYDQNVNLIDVLGRTYRAGKPLTHGNVTETPTRPIVTVTLRPGNPVPPTYLTTLAHELGHALSDCAVHSPDPNELMSAGAVRNGTNRMSDGMLVWLRNQPF